VGEKLWQKLGRLIALSPLSTSIVSSFLQYKLPYSKQPGPQVSLSYVSSKIHFWRMRSSYSGIECLTANAPVATVLGSIPASSDTVESEGGR
jgi:hypothetical protein